MNNFCEEFCKLKELVNSCIEEYLKEDCGHKSYEGAWDVFLQFPDYFTGEHEGFSPIYVRLDLHCYILCPERHYAWEGKDWKVVIKEAKKDIQEWMK